MRVTRCVCKGAAALCARGTTAPSHREALNKYGQYHPSVMSIQKFIDFGKPRSIHLFFQWGDWYPSLGLQMQSAFASQATLCETCGRRKQSRTLTRISDYQFVVKLSSCIRQVAAQRSDRKPEVLLWDTESRTRNRSQSWFRSCSSLCTVPCPCITSSCILQVKVFVWLCYWHQPSRWYTYQSDGRFPPTPHPSQVSIHLKVFLFLFFGEKIHNKINYVVTQRSFSWLS